MLIVKLTTKNKQPPSNIPEGCTYHLAVSAVWDSSYPTKFI